MQYLIKNPVIFVWLTSARMEFYPEPELLDFPLSKEKVSPSL